MAEESNRNSLKKTFRWPTGTGKNAQHHWPPGKCKSKPY